MKSQKMILGLVAALGGMLVGTGTARAAAVLDFQLGGTGGGTISYAGGAAPLVGANIPVGIVSATGTPLNDGVSLNITGLCGGRACLNFTTGNLVSTAGSQLTFGSGTAFTITGAIPAQGTFAGLASTTLLSAVSFDAFVFDTGRLSFTIPNGTDTKNATLVVISSL